MSDELERLRRALAGDAVPEPDAAAKARALALAMENFDRSQGRAGRTRQGKDRPRRAGALNGVRGMSSLISSRFLLATTGSLAALCVALVVVLPSARDEAPGLPRPAVAPTLKTVPDAAAPEAVAPRMEAVPGKAVDRAGDAAPAPQPAPMADAAGDEAVTHAIAPPPSTEAFANAPQGRLHVTAEEPVSTFSIDVDTASYAIVRSSLEAGRLPPPDAVRIEEMINYFPYAYPAPEPGAPPFRTTVTVTPTPWNPGTRLVHIGLQGRQPEAGARPPLNLVFLIDTSGSMQHPAKLPLLKQSFGLMLGRLSPADQVAIVTYAGSAGEVLAPTPADQRQTILDALDRLDAGGSTAGEEGLRLAYRTAAGMSGAGEISRVILATDGDFNVGIADPEDLKTLIAEERDSGIYLSVLGFGRGNLDDATMQALAQNGNGQAAYIDRLGEAQKVLVDQLGGALFPIANDVKLQVEWNPATVAEYRLIGYETRALARADFADDRVDAGEIGAGHSVTALYEITPADSPARLTDPLRYGEEAAPADRWAGELGFLKLRYKAPGETDSALIETPIPATLSEPSDDVRFAAAIAGFGQLLRGPDRLGDWGWPEAIALAEGARGVDPFGYRIEAVNLMRLAESLSRAE
ncbi:VWA domain-containing protein [Cereibacter sphaeroides]|uniref:vWA domain-containing protein n=1 Tax=Cereibacter sphaeroides TaxID=1063 RepID=UPI001F3E76E9|nr:VWA domain-containing protein [Cereibacter sphaeroides]MCE6951185.1 VWA domain-containing protein [Cereibacter sphaeroides]